MTINFKAYNNILYGSFRPWMDAASNEHKYKLLLSYNIRPLKDNPPNFFKAVSKAFSSMNINTEKENITEFENCSNIQINPQLAEQLSYIEFPAYYNKTSEFFYYLAKNYTIAAINAVINDVELSKSDNDITYKVYRFLKTSRNQLELKVNTSAKDKLTSLIFDYIKLSIFSIHFEIQNRYFNYLKGELLNQIEAIYLIAPEFELEKNNKNNISYFLNKYIQSIKLTVKEDQKKKMTDKILSFGFKEKSTEVLQKIILPLTLNIDFINEELNSQSDFIEVMTSKDLKKTGKQIHIGCETTQFRYILDKLKPFFKNLTLSNIENSELFFSKNGVRLKASNLSRNKQLAPKQKEYIDKFFKELK
jgi:hypothetical protein